jgi:hypothetical protein
MKYELIYHTKTFLGVIAAAAVIAIGGFLLSNSETVTSPNIVLSPINEVKLNYAERGTRAASLKIITPSGGHGSGTLMKYNKELVIFTAAHVTTEGPVYLVQDQWGEQKFAILAYVDVEADFAVLVVEPFQKTKPVKFTLPRYDIRKELDLEVIFSGHPAHHSLITMRGRVAGFEGPSMIINSSAWGGSSGSGVFDTNGSFVGILYAVSVGGGFGGPTIMENFIWVMPNDKLNWEELTGRLDAIRMAAESR